jgi:hypothetical protein
MFSKNGKKRNLLITFNISFTRTQTLGVGGGGGWVRTGFGESYAIKLIWSIHLKGKPVPMAVFTGFV